MRQHSGHGSKSARSAPAERAAQQTRPTPLRIIGGHFRGRKLRYSGDPRTRPMKDRVREAIFNLLGPGIRGTHAIDLFAGTGALGLEALSRGAAKATFFERHFPTAAVIEENVATLGVADVCQVLACDTFVFFQQPFDLGGAPWTVFCSPPYDFYLSHAEPLLKLIELLLRTAPAGSLLAVEADRRFNFGQLPAAEKWDVRAYPPAVVGIYRVG